MIAPGQDAARVVAEQHNALCARGVDQAGDIGHQMFDSIVFHARPTGGMSVAALVRHPDAVAQLREDADLTRPI